MQFSAVTFAQRVLRSPNLALLRMRAENQNICKTLPSAETYAWSEHTANAVLLASRSVPLDTRMNRNQIDAICNSWWWLESTLFKVTDENKLGIDKDMATVRGLLIARGITVGDGRTGLQIIPFGLLDGQVPTPVGGCAWADDETIENSLNRARVDGKADLEAAKRLKSELCRFVAAAAVWMQQRILSTTTGAIERHRRKQIAREHNVPPPSDVKVVQLRRIERQHDPATEATTVNYNWQWIVNGHWRNQAYANGQHKLIYILPYVKGPADKPLKVPKQTVYAVNR